MKKCFFCFFLVGFIFLVRVNFVYSETITAMECEYTDAYKNWLSMPDEERNKVIQPSMCKTNDKFYTLVGNSSVVESYTSTKFDLRNYNAVSSMKNQENTNLCWAFTTMESIQSNLFLEKNISKDLSEAHLAFATQNTLFESYLPFSREYHGTGNFFVSSAYLMSRVGPVSESSVPFSVVTDTISGTRSTTLADISNKKVEIAVNDIVFNNSDQGVCGSDSITSIKKYLVSNGAIGTNMYFVNATQGLSIDQNFNIIHKFLNGEYYYYDGSAYIDSSDSAVDANQSINHAVTIVGWDDTISKDNFSITPSRDGAWLIKNSYGETLQVNTSDGSVDINRGDGGYYWVSYDDINICTSLAGFYNIDTEIEDNVYYHDKLGGINGLAIDKNEVYLANVFEKNSSSSEVLDKVSFYNFGLDQKYDILFGASLESMSVIASGVVDRVGVITVDVEPISLSNGKFYVAIKLSGNIVNVPIYAKASNTSFEMDVENGLSFISVDGKNWGYYSDGTNKFLLPLRVFTSNIDYTFAMKDYEVVPDTLSVVVESSGIDNYDDVKYNVYDINDDDYSNSLNDIFTLENNLSDSKYFNISLNENSLTGDYLLVMSYKYATIKFEFSIVEDEGNLKFMVSSGGENSGDNAPNLVVKDNPNNADVNVDSGVEENIGENPKTGELSVYIISIILVLSLIMLVTFNMYNFKKKTND